MKLNIHEKTFSITLNSQEFLNYNIDIHKVLTDCELNNEFTNIFKKYIPEFSKKYMLSSIYYINQTWTITFIECNSRKIINGYCTINHKFVNKKIEKDFTTFKDFYTYLNQSIYSKYVSIKNGIIFIKDKTKEKYILNYLSEYE